MALNNGRSHRTRFGKMDEMEAPILRKKVVEYRNEDGRFYCDRCDDSFSIWRTLKTHLDLHDGIIKFQCEHCQESFTKNTSLKEHYGVCQMFGNESFIE
jgi:hypothetical protein